MKQDGIKNTVPAIVVLGLMSFIKPGTAFAAPKNQTAPQATSSASPQTKPAAPPFFDYLTRQAKNASVYFVEGEPARYIVTDDAEAARSRSLPDEAARYGYQTETLPSGIVVFHKTYYDEGDLPSVTVEEWRAAVKDMRAIINAVSPHMDMSSPRIHLADGIINSFTPQQIAAMERGRDEIDQRQQAKKPPAVTEAMVQQNGLPVSALNAQQKAEVWRIVRFLSVQNALVEAERGFLKSEVILDETTPVFMFQKIEGVGLFGYEIKRLSDTEAHFVSLSYPYQFSGSLDGTMPTLYTKAKKEFMVPLQNDPTAPSKIVDDTNAKAITLEELVALLNARSASDKPVVLSQELAAKRITFVGELARVSTLDAVRAVASVYGLRVVNAADQITLTRPRARITSDPAQLSAALEEVIPLPFLHGYYRIGQDDDPATKKIKLASGPNISSDKEVTGLRWAAVRRLRQTVGQKIKAASDNRVPLSGLDAKEKEAFATILMSYSLKSLADFIKLPTPAYVTNFNNTVLVGSSGKGSDGKPWLTFFLAQRLSSGSLVQESGFSSPITSR